MLYAYLVTLSKRTGVVNHASQKPTLPARSRVVVIETNGGPAHRRSVGSSRTRLVSIHTLEPASWTLMHLMKGRVPITLSPVLHLRALKNRAVLEQVVDAPDGKPAA